VANGNSPRNQVILQMFPQSSPQYYILFTFIGLYLKQSGENTLFQIRLFKKKSTNLESNVAIIEVKYKSHKNDVAQVLKKSETFKIICDEHLKVF